MTVELHDSEKQWIELRIRLASSSLRLLRMSSQDRDVKWETLQSLRGIFGYTVNSAATVKLAQT